VTEVGSQSDLLAYVDDCLPPAARAAFEARLANDPALARRALRWKGQNQAIRAAFGGDNLRARILDLTRQGGEDVGGDRMRSSSALARRPEFAPARIARAGQIARTPAAPRPQARPRSAAPFKAAATLALSALLIAISPLVGNPGPARGLDQAGIAAYRAFAAAPRAPVEFATGDPAAAAAWLATELQRAIPAPATPVGFSLIGARLAPAGGSTAAFLVYETADRQRLGLLIEPLDAPPPFGPELVAINKLTAATWTGSGHGFALVGDLAPAAMDEIVRSIVASPPI